MFTVPEPGLIAWDTERPQPTLGAGVSDGRQVPGKGVPFVCSWSGGKDSCLALYRAAMAGAKPVALLSMLREDGKRSRSHGLAPEILRAQASSLAIPLVTGAATWEAYEAAFVAALQALRQAGAEASVFGDIDLEDHRRWEEKVSRTAGLEAYLPLWKDSRLDLIDEFLALGFRAVIVATNDERMGQEHLGRMLDRTLVGELKRLGIDPCGEEGEYHTIVIDGPLFARPLQLVPAEASLHSGVWFLDVGLG